MSKRGKLSTESFRRASNGGPSGIRTRVSALKDRLATLALSEPERQEVLRIGLWRGFTGIML